MTIKEYIGSVITDFREENINLNMQTVKMDI